MDKQQSVIDPVSEADAAFVFGHCERLGEDGARKALASNFFSIEHRAMAKLWLDQRDIERQERLSRENRRTAQRTELAAWLAAAFALIAILPAASDFFRAAF